MRSAQTFSAQVKMPTSQQGSIFLRNQRRQGRSRNQPWVELTALQWIRVQSRSKRRVYLNQVWKWMQGEGQVSRNQMFQQDQSPPASRLEQNYRILQQSRLAGQKASLEYCSAINLSMSPNCFKIKLIFLLKEPLIERRENLLAQLRRGSRSLPCSLGMSWSRLWPVSQKQRREQKLNRSLNN